MPAQVCNRSGKAGPPLVLWYERSLYELVEGNLPADAVRDAVNAAKAGSGCTRLSAFAACSNAVQGGANMPSHPSAACPNAHATAMPQGGRSALIRPRPPISLREGGSGADFCCTASSSDPDPASRSERGGLGHSLCACTQPHQAQTPVSQREGQPSLSAAQPSNSLRQATRGGLPCQEAVLLACQPSLPVGPHVQRKAKATQQANFLLFSPSPFLLCNAPSAVAGTCDDADSCVTGLLHTASGPSPDVANLADAVCADDADPPAAAEPIVCRKRIVRDSWTCPICNYDTGKHKHWGGRKQEHIARWHPHLRKALRLYAQRAVPRFIGPKRPDRVRIHCRKAAKVRSNVAMSKRLKCTKAYRGEHDIVMIRIPTCPQAYTRAPGGLSRTASSIHLTRFVSSALAKPGR